ncbi:hypothetical protein E0H62_35950, partial [Rhizobium leguminosarum bv. viciae]
ERCKERPASPAPSSALRALTGVEPRVSTRPSDPRWGEEGTERLRHIPFSPVTGGPKDRARPAARPRAWQGRGGLRGERCSIGGRWIWRGERLHPLVN